LSAKGQGPSKVEHLGTEVLADRHFRYEQIALQTDTFAGKTSAPMYREVLRSGAAVAVLLYDPQAHRFILIEQFRVGAWLNHLPSPWILECVAGRIDEGESAEEAVRREAKEETNSRVEKMEFCGSYLATPGISDELVDVYIGQVDSKHVGGVHGVEHEQEDIRTVIMGVDEALALADRGAIHNVMCGVALYWFARHGEGLRQRWLAALVAD
jgi:ADP-ribose pyrophosphatase